MRQNIFIGRKPPKMRSVINSKRFKAVDYPVMEEDVSSLALQDDMQVEKIEYGGVAKAYVPGFRNSLKGKLLRITLKTDRTFSEVLSATAWNIRIKHIKREIPSDLIPINLFNEYWFFWKRFDPDSKPIRMQEAS